jgi:hypothetical protein
MPYWSGDAFEVANPPVAILPVQSMVMSLASGCAGAALVFLSRLSLSMRLGLLAMLALLPVATKVHLRASELLAVENTLLGLDWFAAIATGLGLACAIWSERARECKTAERKTHSFVLRLTIAMLLACVMASLVRGVSQYVFEHARTLTSFRQDRDTFFASQGWTDGSPMALAFERRISQREASGWFGLSNVFATLMAVSAVMCIVLAAHTRKLGWLLLAVASITGVVLAGSKAGYGVVAIGCAVGFLAVCARRMLPQTFASRATTAGIVLVVLTAAGVWGGLALRGSLGEKLGERSLLFRAQYHQTALNIVANLGRAIDVTTREQLPLDPTTFAPAHLQGNVLTGIGPAAFKDRAMLVKPRTLPEDVSSPHSLALDLAVGFGLAGCAIIVLWGALASLSARGLFSQNDSAIDDQQIATAELPSDGPAAGRDPAWLAVVVACVLPTVIAALDESAIATLDQRVVRLLACLAACVAGVWGLHAARKLTLSVLALALGAAAIACITHLLLELTGVTPGADAWCAALLGAGAGLAKMPRSEETLMRPMPRRVVVVCIGLVLCGLLSARAVSWMQAWQHGLSRAYSEAQPVQVLRMRLREFAAGRPMDGDTAALLAKDIGLEVGQPVLPKQESMQAAMQALQLRQLQPAIKALEGAHNAAPAHLATAQALSRLLTLQADAHNRAGNKLASEQTAKRALGTVERVLVSGETASAWAWLGQLRLTHAQLFETGPAEKPTPLSQATQQSILDAFSRAAVLSPFEGQHPRQLALLAQQFGRPILAKAWATRALAVDDLLRLDPLKQMPPAKRMEIQMIAEQDVTTLSTPAAPEASGGN